jgi:hypothetical protein
MAAVAEQAQRSLRQARLPDRARRVGDGPAYRSAAGQGDLGKYPAVGRSPGI